MKKKKPSLPIPKPLTKTQACSIFKSAFGGGKVIYTKHSKNKMLECAVDSNDLMALARSGFVFNSPEPHPKTGAWNYRMEHLSETLKVVFEVVDNKRIVIRLITVIG